MFEQHYDPNYMVSLKTCIVHNNETLKMANFISKLMQNHTYLQIMKKGLQSFKLIGIKLY